MVNYDELTEEQKKSYDIIDDVVFLCQKKGLTVETLFNKFDSSQKGKLNEKDLFQGLKKYKKVTEEEAKNIMSYIDNSGNDSITFKEFKKSFFKLNEESYLTLLKDSTKFLFEIVKSLQRKQLKTEKFFGNFFTGNKKLRKEDF